MRSLLLAIAFATAAGLPAPAQCAVTGATFTSYGSACSGPFPNQTPSLSGTFFSNPIGCGVSLWMSPYTGCCNTYLIQQVLLFGVARANVPVPLLGSGCALLASPDVVVPFDASVRVFSTTLPTTVVPGTAIHVQGALLYFTTVNGSRSASLTHGVQITFR